MTSTDLLCLFPKGFGGKARCDNKNNSVYTAQPSRQVLLLPHLTHRETMMLRSSASSLPNIMQLVSDGAKALAQWIPIFWVPAQLWRVVRTTEMKELY